MQEITTKTQNYKLLRSGEFGNTFDTFLNIKDAIKSKYNSFGLRYSDRSANGNNFFALCKRDELLKTYNDFIKCGANPKSIIFSASDNDDKSKILIQGEVGIINEEFELAYSTIKGITNREASNRGYKRCTGLTAMKMLQYYLWPSDYEWLIDLIYKYPNHIIEFSTFDAELGNIPHRNTVIWEVRKY